MSEECCGPYEPRKTRTVQRIKLTRPHTAGDACCAPEPVQNATTPQAHEEGDACCGPALPSKGSTGGDEHEVRPPWWRDVEPVPAPAEPLDE